LEQSIALDSFLALPGTQQNGGSGSGSGSVSGVNGNGSPGGVLVDTPSVVQQQQQQQQQQGSSVTSPSTTTSTATLKKGLVDGGSSKQDFQKGTAKQQQQQYVPFDRKRIKVYSTNADGSGYRRDVVGSGTPPTSSSGGSSMEDFDGIRYRKGHVPAARREAKLRQQQQLRPAHVYGGGDGAIRGRSRHHPHPPSRSRGHYGGGSGHRSSRYFDDDEPDVSESYSGSDDDDDAEMSESYSGSGSGSSSDTSVGTAMKASLPTVEDRVFGGGVAGSNPSVVEPGGVGHDDDVEDLPDDVSDDDGASFSFERIDLDPQTGQPISSHRSSRRRGRGRGVSTFGGDEFVLDDSDYSLDALAAHDSRRGGGGYPLVRIAFNPSYPKLKRKYQKLVREHEALVPLLKSLDATLKESIDAKIEKVVQARYSAHADEIATSFNEDNKLWLLECGPALFKATTTQYLVSQEKKKVASEKARATRAKKQAASTTAVDDDDVEPSAPAVVGRKRKPVDDKPVSASKRVKRGTADTDVSKGAKVVAAPPKKKKTRRGGRKLREKKLRKQAAANGGNPDDVVMDSDESSGDESGESGSDEYDHSADDGEEAVNDPPSSRSGGGVKPTLAGPRYGVEVPEKSHSSSSSNNKKKEPRRGAKFA
jgi:hypothetical protein